MSRFGMICVAALLGLGMALCPPAACFADDDAEPVEVEVIEMEIEEADAPEPADDFTLPETGTPEEYMAFIEKVMSTPPKTEPKSPEDFMKILMARFGICAKAAEKIMADKNATDEQYMGAVEIRLTLASVAARQNEDDNALTDAVKTMLEEAKKADRKAAVAQLSMILQMVKLQAAAEEGKEAVEKELNELFALLDAKDTLEDADLQILMMACRMAEHFLDEKAALDIYKKYAAKVKETNPEAGMAFDQAIRRLSILGSEMQIAGKSVGGVAVDVKNLKGKVVLIDFWAMWCGPCIAEIPNMLEMYEKYHARGFEIIGISLDGADAADELKEFLADREIKWEVILDSETDLEGETLSDFYGIQSIPAMYLIGKDGKVISTKARGETLAELLEAQFPEK